MSFCALRQRRHPQTQPVSFGASVRAAASTRDSQESVPAATVRREHEPTLAVLDISEAVAGGQALRLATARIPSFSAPPTSASPRYALEGDLREMTATEAEEVICDFVVRGAGDPLSWTPSEHQFSWPTDPELGCSTDSGPHTQVLPNP
jgi:hypothetical protein